jgi:hypothetical protein
MGGLRETENGLQVIHVGLGGFGIHSDRETA